MTSKLAKFGDTCPYCQIRMTSSRHIGSKACLAKRQIVTLKAKGLVELPTSCMAMAKLVESTKNIWIAGGSIWVKPIVKDAIVAADKIADFLGKTPRFVLDVALKEGTVAELRELGPLIVWNKTATKPTSLFCKIATVFGGRLIWCGVRFFADGHVQVRLDVDGPWQRVDKTLHIAMKARARLGTPESLGERVIRVTYKLSEGDGAL